MSGAKPLTLPEGFGGEAPDIAGGVRGRSPEKTPPAKIKKPRPFIGTGRKHRGTTRLPANSRHLDSLNVGKAFAATLFTASAPERNALCLPQGFSQQPNPSLLRKYGKTPAPSSHFSVLLYNYFHYNPTFELCQGFCE